MSTFNLKCSLLCQLFLSLIPVLWDAEVGESLSSRPSRYIREFQEGQGKPCLKNLKSKERRERERRICHSSFFMSQMAAEHSVILWKLFNIVFKISGTIVAILITASSLVSFGHLFLFSLTYLLFIFQTVVLPLLGMRMLLFPTWCTIHVC